MKKAEPGAGGAGIVWIVLLALLPLRGDDAAKQLADLQQKASAGDAVSQTNLGKDYCYGLLGLKQDYAQGMTWLQKAAAQNNAEAQASIGWLYQTGRGVARDPAQAFQWFTKAAQGGDPYGEAKLGEVYQYGLGTPRDLARAIALYRSAAEAGNDEGLTFLGLIYKYGQGVPRDYRRAFTYLLRAAYDNLGWAQYEVAWFYGAGQFVPGNLAEAERWCVLASQNGYNEPALARALSWLASNMSASDLADAQRLVRNWSLERAGVNLQSASLPVAYSSGQQASIPFPDFFNLVTVSATINGHPNLTILLDSGSPNSMLDDKTAGAIGVLAGRAYRPSSGIGPEPLLMAASAPVDLELPGVSLSGVRFMQTPTSAWDDELGVHIDGILGSDVLDRFVVHIDFIRRTVELIDPAAFKPTDPAAMVLPLTAAGPCVMVSTAISQAGNTPPPLPFVVDTGSYSGLYLSHEFIAANPPLHLTEGGFPTRGGGLGGEAKEFIHKIDQLKLGTLVVPNPSALVPATDQNFHGLETGTIGNEIWRRFDMTIDYPHHKLYLKPNASFGDRFDYQDSGLEIRATGPDLHTYVVHSADADSPGSRAGFLPGDVLTQIDQTPLAGKSMAEMRRLFKAPGKHSIIVLRDGKPVTLTFSYEDAPTAAK